MSLYPYERAESIPRHKPTHARRRHAGYSRPAPHLQSAVATFGGVVVVLWFLGVSVAIARDAPTAAPHVSPEKLTVEYRDDAQPTPDHSPRDVVQIQLRALERNDDPYEDAGVEVAFRFASPANRTVTGSLELFTQMVHSPTYQPMLNHRSAEYGALRVRGNKATQPVMLTAADGQQIGYMFLLSRQDGGQFVDCWMTDGVVRFAAPEGEPQSPRPSEPRPGSI